MKKYKVFGLDKSNKNNKKNYKINLLNKKKMSNFFKFHKPEIVFHLAGYSTIDNINKRRAYIKNNIQATKNLIAEMKRNKIGKIVFSSTAAVYNAKNRRKLLTEKSLLKPNNLYILEPDEVVSANNNSIVVELWLIVNFFVLLS